MSVDLATVFKPQTDELFQNESKRTLVTCNDFDWTGAHSVKVWKISTVPMQDYARNRGADAYAAGADPVSVSRYGELIDLDAQTEEMILSRDRSFIFNVDRLDTDETASQVEAASALARQLRNVVIPEIDGYIYGKMVSGAGTTEDGEYTAANLYADILAATETLDENEVPEEGRVLLVPAPTYADLKALAVFDHTDVGADLRRLGVVGMLDGAMVVKVPSAKLPDGVVFILCHPSATVAPVKLEDYTVHDSTPLSSGSIVTGRVCYDAFVLDNKAKGIYVRSMPANVEPDADPEPEPGT